MYWVSAISQPAERLIHVGVPQFIEANQVGSMSDDAHLLLAAIARHDSLTEPELHQVTGVPGSRPKSSPMAARGAGAVWITTCVPGSSIAFQTSSVSSLA